MHSSSTALAIELDNGAWWSYSIELVARPDKNSLLANGCEIRGTVENSILFRGVKVGKDVTIKNSIIMQKCDIQDGSLIENVICDKNVVITKDKWLKGAVNYPLIITKNVVI